MTPITRALTATEADRLLAATDGADRAVPLAGGTDLLVQRRSGREFPALVDLSGLGDDPVAAAAETDARNPARVSAVTTTADGALRLRATACLTDIAAGLGTRFPAMRMAIGQFAAETIRNRATIGGNLATGSPGADTVPPLLAAGAVIELRGAEGKREADLQDFLLGPRSVDLRPGEWIEAIRVPAPPAVGGMRKVAGRRAQAISLVSLAWQWDRDPDGRLHGVRLAMGAVAPTVVRLPATEALLEGQRYSPILAERAAETAVGEIAPIDDARAGAGYRRRATAGLLHEILATTDPAATHPAATAPAATATTPDHQQERDSQ